MILMKEAYTGKFRVGQVVYHRGHRCEVTAVWKDPDNHKNGISIIPTGGYGFEVDLYEEQLQEGGEH